jgi:hypothetical protein
MISQLGEHVSGTVVKCVCQARLELLPIKSYRCLVEHGGSRHNTSTQLTFNWGYFIEAFRLLRAYAYLLATLSGKVRGRVVGLLKGTTKAVAHLKFRRKRR